MLRLERRPDGLRLHAGDASLGVGARRSKEPVVGAGVVVYPKTLGFATQAALGAFSVNLYGAVRPATWVDWQTWVRLQNPTPSRLISFFATARECEWSLWVPMAALAEDHVNTVREGVGEWADLLLGKLREKVMVIPSKAALTMGEGTYALTVERREVETTRERWPFPKYDVSVTVTPKAPIPLSFAPSVESATYAHGDTAKAIREFKIMVKRRRYEWTPPLKFRPKGGYGEVLEKFSPTTGTWRQSRMTKVTVPAGSVVEPPSPFPWHLVAASMVGITGFLRGALAVRARQ